MTHHLGVVAVLLTSCAFVASAPAAAGDTPIAFLGHGAAFTRDGTEITITRAVVAAEQQRMLARLYDAADPARRTQFIEKRQMLRAAITPGSPAALYADALFIDGFVRDTAAADRDATIANNRYLQSFLREALPDAALTVLAQAGLALPAAEPSFEVLQAREAYIKKCAKAGVPTPPTWNAAVGNQWVEAPKLLTTLFIDTNKPYTRVFSYRSANPQGLCLALPRGKSDADPLSPLGIICLGTQTNNACFWDNQQDGMAFTIGLNEEVPLRRFAGGAELVTSSGGVCTGCHAGRNPYIVHPKTQLDIADRNGKDWYVPLISDAWPKNPKPTVDILAMVASTKDCNGCHSLEGKTGGFPVLSPEVEEYCSVIVRRSIRLTMPPNSAKKLPDTDYQGHYDALLAACNPPPRP